MAQPQADRVWVAMAETSAGALVERVAEAGAECMDGDLEGQDGLRCFRYFERGFCRRKVFATGQSIGCETGAIIQRQRMVEGRETGG